MVIDETKYHDGIGWREGRNLLLCKKTNNDYCHGLLYRLFVCTDVYVHWCWGVLAALVCFFSYSYVLGDNSGGTGDNSGSGDPPPDCYHGRGMFYTGDHSFAGAGQPCEPWIQYVEQLPSLYLNPDAYGAATMEEVGNRCRFGWYMFIDVDDV